MPKTKSFPVQAKNFLVNPSKQELRDLIAKMPNSRETEFGNYNVETRVVSRSKANTYIVTDDPENYSDQCISRAEYEQWVAKQDAYIAEQEMVVVEGYIGSRPRRSAPPARLIIEAANANVAGDAEGALLRGRRRRSSRTSSLSCR